MCPGDVNLPGRTGSGFWCLVNWGRCSVFLCWFSVFWWRGRVQQTAAIRRRLRIAAESMRVARQLAHGFLRESAAGLSLSPPAMCHMLPVNHSRQEGGGVFLATAISVAHIQLCKYQPVYPLSSSAEGEQGYWSLIGGSDCDRLGADGCQRESEELDSFSSNQLTALKQTAAVLTRRSKTSKS